MSEVNMMDRRSSLVKQHQHESVALLVNRSQRLVVECGDDVVSPVDEA